MALVESITLSRLNYDSKSMMGINLEKHVNDVSLKFPLTSIDNFDYNKANNNIMAEARNMSFNVNRYNNTLQVKLANQAFNEQLASSPLGPITRDDLFRELAPLFQWSKRDPFPYAVCLIHHHFLLENGERMVTYGEPTANQPVVTRPSEDLKGVTPDRWFSNGEEFEYKVIEGGEAPPPSREFLSRFREIISRRGVDILGVCLSPDTSNLSPGQIFKEREVPGKRELELSIINQPESVAPNVYQTTWIPTDGDNAMWMCGGVCIQHGLEPTAL